MSETASSPNSNMQSALEKYGIKPLNKSNLLNYYAPMYGVANYGFLAVNVMNPSWMIKISPKRDLTKFLLLGCVVGTGLYMSQTKLVQSAPKQKIIIYSVCGSVLFSCGSVLVWALLRAMLPDNRGLAVTAGLGSAVAIATVAKQYLEYVDSNLK